MRGHGEDVLHYSVSTYYYRVMSFGLKNARVTYQRAVTTIFHDMMHQDVEVYVDDMIVKSQIEQIIWQLWKGSLRRSNNLDRD